SASALVLSFVLLVLGFVFDALSWQTVLHRSGHRVGVRESIAAVGLSAFAKYIPGKIWAVMGRAAYLTERCGYSLTQLTSVSMIWQFIMLWIELVFGALGLLLLGQILRWGFPILLMWLVLTTVIFSDAAQSVFRRAYKMILKKDISIPRLTIGSTFVSMPWCVVTWIAYSAGFYYLVRALYPGAVPFAAGLGFPLSIILGILAIVVPGGIGVREGAIVVYLSFCGVPVKEATTISIAARLWFLMGEAAIFAIGFVMDLWLKQSGGTGTHKPSAK
ncbi:MAG: flippase-like domain-containing protein, partial [Candidatus Latescibacterota bacterium]